MGAEKGMTLGVIFGNRDFFPDGLVAEARRDLLEVLASLGVNVIALSPEQTKLGAVETWQHAVLCSELLRENKQRIDGVLV
jgi:L-fucose isomerase-like protein